MSPWTLGLFDRVGPWEIVLILLAILLLFGGRKLPELARGLAKSMRIFRDELHGVSKDLEKDDNEGGKQPPGEKSSGEGEKP